MMICLKRSVMQTNRRNHQSKCCAFTALLEGSEPLPWQRKATRPKQAASAVWAWALCSTERVLFISSLFNPLFNISFLIADHFGWTVGFCVLETRVMELADLEQQCWSLGRQLNSLYRTLEQVGGIAIRPVERFEKPPQPVAGSAVTDGIEREDAQHLPLAGLQKEEAALRLEIRDLLVKLPVRPPQPDDVPTLAPSADALRRFLMSHGGETGGWDDRDHALFLQWRSRFRNNRQSFVNAVADTVPGKTAGQVEAHERWYQQLLKLRHEQRLELDEWKRRKRIQDEDERKKALDNQQANESDVWVSKWRRQRETIRQQVQRWKEEKAKAEAEAEAEAAEPSESDLQKKEAEQRRQIELQYQKLMAYLWRAEQEAARQAAKSAEDYVSELSRKQRRANSASSRLAERREASERQWVDQRRQQLLERIKRNECAPIVKTKRAVSAPRDPKRLLRPTTATTARRLHAIDDDQHDEATKQRTNKPVPSRDCSSYILDVQSRTVPSWRRHSMGN